MKIFPYVLQLSERKSIAKLQKVMTHTSYGISDVFLLTWKAHACPLMYQITPFNQHCLQEMRMPHLISTVGFCVDPTSIWDVN